MRLHTRKSDDAFLICPYINCKDAGGDKGSGVMNILNFTYCVGVMTKKKNDVGELLFTECEN